MSGTFLDDIRRRQSQRAKEAGKKAAAAQTATSTAEEDEGEEQKKGILERGIRAALPGFAEDPVLKTGSLIGKALDLGGEYVVRPTVGFQAKAAANIGQGDPFTNILEEAAQNPLFLVPGAGPIGNVNAARRAVYDDEEMDERIRQADGYRAAFNESYKGRPIEQLTVEMAADPMNLLGVGLVGKAAKAPKIAQAAGRSAALRNTLKYSQKADEALDAIQSAPINLPVRGLQKVAPKLPGFERSQSAVLRGKESILRANRKLTSRGNRDLDPTGVLATASEDRIIAEAARHLGTSEDAAREFIISLPDAKLGRIFENETLPQPLRPLVNREIRDRGLRSGGNRTGKLTAYMQLDRVADQRQLSSDARKVMLGIADMFATTLHNISPEQYPTLDAAYDEIGAAPTQASRASDFAASSRQRGDDRLAKGVYQPQTGYAIFTPLMDMTTVVHEILGHMLRYSVDDESARAFSRMMGGRVNDPRFEEAFAEGIENFLRTGDISQFPDEFKPLIEAIRQHTGETYRQGVPAARLTPAAAETVAAGVSGPQFGSQSPVTPVTPPAAGQNALPGFLPTQQQAATPTPTPPTQAVTPQQQRLNERRAGQQQLPGVSNRPNSRNMQPAPLVDLNRTIPAKEAGKKAAQKAATPRANGRVTNREEIEQLTNRVNAIETDIKSATRRGMAQAVIDLRSQQGELKRRIADLEGRPVLPNGMVAAAPTDGTPSPAGFVRPNGVRQPPAGDLEDVNSGSGVFNENLYTEDEVVWLNEQIDKIGTQMEELREAGYGRGDIDQSDMDELNRQIDELQVRLDDERAFAQADREEAQLRIDELREKLETVTPQLDEANARIQTLEDQRNELTNLLDSNLKSESRRMWAERKLAEVEAEIQSLYESGAVGGIRGGDPNLAGGLGDGTGVGAGNGSISRLTVGERAARRRGVDEFANVEPREAKSTFDRIVASGVAPEVDEAFHERVKNAIRKNSHQSGARKPTDKYKQGSVIKGQTLDGANRKITVSDLRTLTGAPDDDAVIQSLAKLKIENPEAFGEMNLMGQITPKQDEKGNVLFQKAGDYDETTLFDSPFSSENAVIGDGTKLAYAGPQTKFIEGLNPDAKIDHVTDKYVVSVYSHSTNQFGEKVWDVSQLEDGKYVIFDGATDDWTFTVKNGKLTSSESSVTGGTIDPHDVDDIDVPYTEDDLANSSLFADSNQKLAQELIDDHITAHQAVNAGLTPEQLKNYGKVNADWLSNQFYDAYQKIYDQNAPTPAGTFDNIPFFDVNVPNNLPEGSSLAVINIMDELDDFGSLTEEILATPGTKLYKLDGPNGGVAEEVAPNSPYASAYPNWKFDQLEDGDYAVVPLKTGEFFDFSLSGGKVTAVPTGSSKVTQTSNPTATPVVPVVEKGMLAAGDNGGDVWELGSATKYLNLSKGWSLSDLDGALVTSHKSWGVGSDNEWKIESLPDNTYSVIAPDGELVADFVVKNKWITDVGGGVKYSNPLKITPKSPPQKQKNIPHYPPGTTPKWDEPAPEPFATSVRNYGDLNYTYSISDPATLDADDTLGASAHRSLQSNKWDNLPDTLSYNDYDQLQYHSPNTVGDASYRLAQDREMYRDGGKIHWAVRHYTSSGYDQINGVARGQTGLGGQYVRSGVTFTDDDWKTLARVMDDYIDAREPLDATITTFRGIKLYDKDRQEFVDQMTPGFRFSEDGFTSVSTSFETADRIFSGGAPAKTMFRVEMPAGTKMAFGYPNEKELILPRGAVFEVKKVSRVHDMSGIPFRVVDVKYVGSPKTGEIGIDETLRNPSIVNTPSKFKDPLFQRTGNVQSTNIFSSQDPFGSGRTNATPLSQARGQQEPIATPREGQLSQLGRNATTSEAVNRIANLAGIQPGGEGEKFVAENLDSWVGQNPEHFQALELTYPKAAEGFAESMRLAEAGDTAAAREKMLDTLDEMNQQAVTFGVRHPRLDGILKAVTNKRGTKKSTFLGRDENATTAADYELEVLREAASIPEVQKFQKDYDKSVENVETTLADMHAAGKPVVGEITSSTPISKVYDAWNVAEGAQKETLGAYLKLATGKDPDKITQDLTKITEADAYAEGTVFRYHREMAKRYGIKEKTPNAFTKALGSAAKMWREQALLSVRYHTVNALDMSVRSAIYGINPVVSENSAYRFADEIGEAIPDDIIVRSSAIVDGEERIVGSDMMLGTKDPEISKLPVIGKPAGALVKKNRELGSFLENSARRAAWMTGLRNHLEQVVLPKFNNELTRVLGDTPEVGDITRELAAVKGRVSSQRMFEIITERGYSVDQANELATVWKRGTSEASATGRDLAKKLHFDYAADTRVIEEKLSLFAILPFHYWATRNIPFYLDTLAQHPELARLWQTYDQVSDENREDEGLTQRFTGMIPVDVPLLDHLFGEGTGYFNPLVALSLTDQVKPRYTPEDATGFAELLNEAGRVGLSPAPWIVTPLTVAGLYGDRADAPDTLRHSRLIGAGLDAAGSKLGIESDITPTPIRSTVDAVQETVTGKEKFTLTGDSYKDSRVTKKLAELSISETGDANHPDYVRAMADPEHPLFKRALAEVNKEMFFEQLYGFAAPVPMKHLPKVEADIRRSRKQLADEYGGIRQIPDDIYSQLRESGDVSTGYFKSGGDARGRQVFAGFDRSRGLQKNWDVLERRRINEELPFYSQYIAWSNAQPAGADTSVDAFTKAT